MPIVVMLRYDAYAINETDASYLSMTVYSGLLQEKRASVFKCSFKLYSNPLSIIHLFYSI